MRTELDVEDNLDSQCKSALLQGFEVAKSDEATRLITPVCNVCCTYGIKSLEKWRALTK